MRKLLLVALLASPVVPLATWVEPSGSGDVELAPFMSRLQIYSQKLGFAIQARNTPLSNFYLHEVHEVLEEIQKKVPVHDGHQIAELIGATSEIEVHALQHLMKDQTATWETRNRGYVALTQSCNTCHQATAHGFIHILPAKGKPPFNQSFAPQNPAAPK